MARGTMNGGQKVCSKNICLLGCRNSRGGMATRKVEEEQSPGWAFITGGEEGDKFVAEPWGEPLQSGKMFSIVVSKKHQNICWLHKCEM